MTLQEIQTQLDNEPPLRIRGLLKKRKETLREFLIKFFESWNKEKVTIYVNNGHTQTEVNKRRSIGDIYRICKYYYPKTTLKEVKDIVIDLFPENNSDEQTISTFRSSRCNQIRKRVYYVGSENQDSDIYDKSSQDEYGYTWANWCEL